MRRSQYIFAWFVPQGNNLSVITIDIIYFFAKLLEESKKHFAKFYRNLNYRFSIGFLEGVTTV